MMQEPDDELREIIDCFLLESIENLDAIEPILIGFEHGSAVDIEDIHAMFRALHSIKGNASYLTFALIEQVAHAAETALQTVCDGIQPLTQSLVDSLFAVIDVLKEAFANVRQHATDHTPPTEANVVLLLQQLAQVHQPAEGASVTASPAQPPSVPVQLIDTDTAPTLRVEIEKLDHIMELIGELLIATNTLRESPALNRFNSDDIDQATRRISTLARHLQDETMNLRMIPIRSVFQKMHRLVRDVSHRQNKAVRLIIEGAETEIDKQVAAHITDPLMHLLRNAIDHGLETSEHRRQKGKNPIGAIVLSAQHRGNEVWVRISDDGRGLNREAIVARAQHLFDDPPETLTDQQVHRFIFRPGITTVQALSDISGRGIGLDVVHKNITAIGGRIDVQSRRGHGCTFTLRIPLTLTVIDGMLMRVGTNHLTLPLLQIRESIQVSARQIMSLSGGRELIRVRGEVMPIIRLHRFFAIQQAVTSIEDGVVVIVEHDGRTLGLLVDDLIGQRQTVIKPLPAMLGEQLGLAGCTLLGNGDISLIVDLSSLISALFPSAA